MHNVINIVKKQIEELVKKASGFDGEIEVSATKDSKFGDFAVNIAMRQAKVLGKNPRELAEEIIGKMNFEGSYIERCEV
ncbi:MAG: arginine--tRNA ligase, partial [Oscillospiraceae bacterium]|nr:arginine--tRNA ligase [Oscillospiraceae bacterium]